MQGAEPTQAYSRRLKINLTHIIVSCRLYAPRSQENDLLLRDNQELAQRVEALEEERLLDSGGGHRSYSERRRAATAGGDSRSSRSST